MLCGFFTALGIWIGHRLTRRSPVDSFEVNTKALTYLGISERETAVLSLLTTGRSNQEIADQLFVSPNTVKTHLNNLYRKLDVTRRGQAVQTMLTFRQIALEKNYDKSVHRLRSHFRPGHYRHHHIER
jgi:DNA-binding CsgD family transcriptional regulator